MNFHNEGRAARLLRRRRLALGATLILSAALGCGLAGDAGSPEESAARGPLLARQRVRIEPVRFDVLADDHRVTATVRAFHRATLTAETQGRVVKRVVEPGTRVEKEGRIVLIEDSRARLELRRAEASLAAARTVLAHAERELARGDQLLGRKALSTQAHDDLKHGVDRAGDEVALARVTRDTARRTLADTRITAPFDGSVDSIAVDVGDYVAPGTPIAVLVDLSRVRIYGGVTAAEAARLEPGATAQVSFRDLGGKRFEATLESVARVASAADGTYAIELWMDDPEAQLRDGLVAQVELPDPQQTPTLLAKRAALLRRDGHPEVFVVEGEGASAVARARRVRTGRSAGDWIEVLEGLVEGERIVWDGQFALGDGVAVVIDGEG